MEPPCETKPIGKSFKCQVSSVKKGKAVVWASNFTLYTSNSAEGRLYEQTQFARYAGRTKEFPVRCRRWRFCAKNPEYRFGSCGILVFWYSGLAPRKTLFFGAGTVCIWHVARGGLDFWGKNEGDKGDSLRRGDRLCKTKPIARSGAPRRCRRVGRHVEYPTFQYSIIPAFQFHAQSPQHHRRACLAGGRMLW